MARVTVEDCVDKVPNRFELVLLAAHRARALASGAHMTVDAENDKNGVIALREIAEKTVDPRDVREGFIHATGALAQHLACSGCGRRAAGGRALRDWGLLVAMYPGW